MSAHTSGTDEGRQHVVIVGAGHAGGTLASLLRQEGYSGSIALLGSEPDAPYHRPPLSKKFAEGDNVQWLRPVEFYSDNDIDLRVSSTVTCIDIAARCVHLDSGDRLDYDTVVLATGASARILPVPGAELRGVLSLRTVGESRMLRDGVRKRARMAIIGGGYIGLEVAASARAHGCEVVIVEREDRVLARVASQEFANILTEFHRSRGTRILTDASITEIRGTSGSVTSIVLGDGSEIECDLVLVGIGAVPNDALARESGIACDNGILVDGACRTSDPHVLAIGDVTSRIHDGLDRRMRLESIPSAVEQAKQAAAVICGTDVPMQEVPWFWSDQFDLRMKMAGVFSEGSDAVLRGDPGTGKFAIFHVRADDTIASIEVVNSPAEFMAGKKYMAGGVRLDRTRLADTTISMRDIVCGNTANRAESLATEDGTLTAVITSR